MMSTGLLVMSVIQVATGVTALVSVRVTNMWGIRMLPRDLSLYRYMLTALWLSVGLIL